MGGMSQIQGTRIERVMANVCGPMSTPWDHPIKIWNGAHIPRNPSKFLACLSKHFSKHGRWGPIYATGFPHCSCSLIRRITHIHILYAFHSGCMTAPRKRQNKLLCHFTEMESKVREVKWVAQSHTLHTYCRWGWNQVCCLLVPCSLA